MIISVIFRTILFYILVIVRFRIISKKEIHTFNSIEQIGFLLFLGITILGIISYQIPILIFLISMIIITFFQYSLDYLTLKSVKLRRIVGGPILLIKNGKINFQEISNIHYSLDDLIKELRKQGINQIEEVGYAILEEDKTLSVFQMGSSYPLPVIVNGKINYGILHNIKKNMKWIDDILEKNQIRLENVFYAFYTNDQTFIIRNPVL